MRRFETETLLDVRRHCLVSLLWHPRMQLKCNQEATLSWIVQAHHVAIAAARLLLLRKGLNGACKASAADKSTIEQHEQALSTLTFCSLPCLRTWQETMELLPLHVRTSVLQYVYDAQVCTHVRVLYIPAPNMRSTGIS